MITRRAALSGLVALPLLPSVTGERLVPWETRLILAARRQIGITVRYDPAYVSLDYPNGDVPRERGVCTDVVIRAYRDAFDFDLQSAVHEDTMRLNGSLPHIGIVSDRVTAMGHHYVLHNIGAGTAEDDILGLFDEERRFRFEPPVV